MKSNDQIKTLVRSLIRAGKSPQDISWLFISIITKECDIYYRIDQPLSTGRLCEPNDNPMGDSIHNFETTKEELDEQLDIYFSHKRDCKCYLSTNDCPICLDGMTEQQIECCDNYIHQKCLAAMYQKGNTKCPMCRYNLKLDINSFDIPMVVADVPKVLEDLSNKPSGKLLDNKLTLDVIPLDNNRIRYLDLTYGYVIELGITNDVIGIIRDGSRNINKMNNLTEEEAKQGWELGLHILWGAIDSVNFPYEDHQ